MALALIPLKEVETSFYNLRSTVSAQVKQELRPLFVYYEDYWLNSIPVEMWNVHGSELRTNNICEGIYISLLFIFLIMICTFRIS